MELLSAPVGYDFEILVYRLASIRVSLKKQVAIELSVVMAVDGSTALLTVVWNVYRSVAEFASTRFSDTLTKFGANGLLVDEIE